MNMEATTITALITLLVLALVTVVMVRKYNRTHQAEIRARLLDKAEKYDIAAPEELETSELAAQVRAAKHEQKQRNLKTA